MDNLLRDLRKRNKGPLWKTPLLPLPAPLLFPGRKLPIHLEKDVFTTLIGENDPYDILISIATIQPEIDLGSFKPEPVFDVVGVGRIVRTTKFSSGYNVTFEGISRGKLIAEEITENRRLGFVVPLDESGAREEVERELSILLSEVGDLGPFANRFGKDLSPGQIADLINAHLPEPITVKQEIFEILDVATRIRKVRRKLKEFKRKRRQYFTGSHFPY